MRKMLANVCVRGFYRKRDGATHQIRYAQIQNAFFSNTKKKKKKKPSTIRMVRETKEK